jgi:hypothetical protein
MKGFGGTSMTIVLYVLSGLLILYGGASLFTVNSAGNPVAIFMSPVAFVLMCLALVAGGVVAIVFVSWWALLGGFLGCLAIRVLCSSSRSQHS